MTDEYKAFLESKRSESSDHQEIEHAEIPHWKPPEKKEPEQHTFVSVSEYLEHYGVKGMKWGIINEKEYENVTKERSTVGEYAHNLASKIKGTDEHEARLKESATRGLQQAEMEFTDYSIVRDSRSSSPEKLNKNAGDYLWGINADLQSLKLYNEGNAFAAQQVYRGAKKFDMLMQSIADEQGVAIDELEFVKNMQDGNPSDYDALEDAVEQIANSMGLSKEGGEKEYKEATDTLRDLLYTTGYTSLKDGVRREKKDDKESQKKKWWKFGHDGMLEGEHLEHHGVKGQKWGIRRYQNEDGTRINAEPRKKKEPEFNSKTLKYKKKPQHLTDEELNRRNRRMQMEVQYNQLRSQLQPKSKADKRRETMRTIFVATATTAAAAIMVQVYKKGAEFIINKASGGRINISGKGSKKS